MNAELIGALERAAAATVLLVASDFDGTLSPLAPMPGLARADEGALAALRALARIESTHAVILSGRSRDDLADRLGPEPGVMIIGSHGAERDGRGSVDPATREAVRAAVAAAKRVEDEHPGVVIEEKPAGVAIHYRHVDPSRHAAVVARVAQIADASRVVSIKPGIFVEELVFHKETKGTALEWARRWFGAGAVVFFGDDRTDEDAFVSLRGEDVGVRVGDGATSARFRVADPGEVRAALEMLADRRGRAVRTAGATPIETLAFLSDQRACALVDGVGTVVYACVPRFDAPAVFASLLGGDAQGLWSIAPAGGWRPERAYIGESFVLRTRSEDVELLDWMDCSGGRAYQRAGRTDLIRRVSGRGRVVVRFAPRLDFGACATTLRPDEFGLRIEGGADPMVLVSRGVDWRITREGVHDTAEAIIDLSEGPVDFELRVGAAGLGAAAVPIDERQRRTTQFWESWARSLRPTALATALVRRSALVIKSLCYGPEGSICAAGTLGLPEQIGGVRNWDYRYCWIRDAAWSAAALVRLGSTGHAIKYLDWLYGVVEQLESPERLMPLYTVGGRRLGEEIERLDLPGYAGSRPVRVGNAAATQVQLDVFGTVADLIALMVEAGAPLTPDHFRLLDLMVLAVARRWREPDHGIWEIRGEPRHHVSSKVMCWFTVDRAIAARRDVHGEERESDRALREEIRRDVLERGFDASVGAFTTAYGYADLDAASLLVGLTGLVEPADPRFASTVEAVSRELRRGPTVYRYVNDDGLPGREGGFNICTGWLIESLWLVGRRDEARALFDAYAGLAGPLGLMAEEFDPEHARSLGNYPQAYSHLALINAAVRLGGF